MKKIISILILIMVVIGISGCISSTKEFNNDIVSFSYPESWNITTNEIMDNNMQLVIQDPTSTSNPQSTQIAAFTILTEQNNGSETLEQGKDIFVQSFIDSGANISLKNTSNTIINGISATEVIYDGNDPNHNTIQLKVIYFEQNNMLYILGFFTKGMDLQSQNTNFDVIINSFKLQSRHYLFF